MPGDLGAMFVQAARAVSAPVVRADERPQLFPGDMYKSCGTCAFLASDSFPDANASHTQYACVPLELHLFVLGPIKCDTQSLAVLITIREWKADKSCLGAKTHLAVYTPCSGTLFFRQPVPVHGTRENLHFRATLPLQNAGTGCGFNVTHARLARMDECDTSARALFDASLALFLGQCNGLVHAVDWACLLRLKLLAASGAGILAASTALYQARLEDCTDADKYLLCTACAHPCGDCTSTSMDVASCSSDPTAGCTPPST